MPIWFDEAEYAAVEVACERVVPGSREAGAVDYIDALLGAFSFDPPRIWADGRGGWLPLSRLEERAWRERVADLQRRYREGIEALIAAGDDLDALPEFKALLFRHAVEGTYGSPDYGGNRDRVGWRTIRFPGDAMPRGYTAAEVSEP